VDRGRVCGDVASVERSRRDDVRCEMCD
jgi:hypothetical protein